jgi:geranylgeranyl diphosphate synthase type II
MEEYLPSDDRFPKIIFESMRYSALNGGKRLRPILTLAACDAVGGDESAAMPAACAIEMIHAFSLIHDDLPALDNDDLRRGKPTNHKVFGEAIAILAGDLLLTYAFQLIPERTKGVPSDVVLEVVRKVASATGVGGMIVGQVVDMLSEGKHVSPETLEFMHRNKTGALMEASVVCGGMLGGGSPEQIEALRAYGQNIGLAFQIADDVLDIEGDEVKIGKPVGSDLENRKSTYPSLYGLERSKEMALQAASDAANALRIFGSEADPLRALARFIVEREA